MFAFALRGVRRCCFDRGGTGAAKSVLPRLAGWQGGVTQLPALPYLPISWFARALGTL